MLHILEGQGSIQVDFKNYFNWDNKIIFLEKGQYIKFLTSKFLVRQIIFDDEVIFKNREVRVLFKHLVSLGYINFQDCVECQKYLNNTVLSEPRDIIDVSSQHWYWQNPFKAKADEYHIIFDVKDIIDQEYKNHLNNSEIGRLIGDETLNAQALFSNKIGITVKKLLGRKRLTESKKEIAFTDKSIKEISYDYGYKDQAYFNRIFKQNTGLSPIDFRNNVDFERRDTFVEELYDLIHKFHTEQRSVAFYAQKFNLTTNAFSKKVKDKLNISIGQLIRQQLIITSKNLIDEGYSIKDASYELGFEEPNHFSTFFKHLEGLSPTEYQFKKYK